MAKGRRSRKSRKLSGSFRRYKYNFYAAAVMFAFIAYPLIQLFLFGEVTWDERGIEYTVKGVQAKVMVLGPLLSIVAYVIFSIYKVYRDHGKI